MVQTMTSLTASQNIRWKTLKLQNAASFCQPWLIEMLAIRNLFKVTWRFGPATKERPSNYRGTKLLLGKFISGCWEVDFYWLNLRFRRCDSILEPQDASTYKAVSLCGPWGGHCGSGVVIRLGSQDGKGYVGFVFGDFLNRKMRKQLFPATECKPLSYWRLNIYFKHNILSTFDF